MTIPDSAGYWIAGFMDGESSFNITKDNRTYASYSTRMMVSLRDDDALTLRRVHALLGIGRISYRDNIRAWTNAKSVVTWQVQSLAECVALCELLDRYPLRSKKARDYAIWREAVEVRAVAKREGHKPDWSRVAYLSRCLSDVRAYSGSTAKVGSLEWF